MEDHIEKILFTEKQISQRVSELASQITLNFAPSTNNGGPLLSSSSSSSAPVVIGVATGAFLFLADLVRQINLPISVDFVRVESYGSGTVSSGKPRIFCDLKIDVTGKHVILVRMFLLDLQRLFFWGGGENSLCEECYSLLIWYMLLVVSMANMQFS